MGIKVLDNFLSSMYVDSLENLITNAELPLYFNLDTLAGHQFKKGKESPQFIHSFVKNEQLRSNFMAKVEPIIFNFAAKTEVLYAKRLINCKLNLNYKDVSFTENEFFPVHKDTENNGVTAIYYVNDCDGDTLFFNNDAIVETVSPKKGRLVYFDNQILHAGQPPKKSLYRALINFNWI